jgi:hypothetical protein
VDQTLPDHDRHAEDRRAYSMRALGKSDLPTSFEIDGTTYCLSQTVKHDFFAATGFYEAGGRTVVLKISRTEDFAGIPLRWLGRWLCNREMRFYHKLADLPNVPNVIGRVADTGFVHDYVVGRPLARDKPVPDLFFQRLSDLLEELHRRGIAYVDTNKPENILLGDDGLPHLIDFQISWDVAELGNWFLNRWWLSHLQHEDRYHVLKHKRRMRPDEMSEHEQEIAERKSPLIRLHRLLFKPYFLIRRRTFKRLRETGRLLPEGSK